MSEEKKLYCAKCSAEQSSDAWCYDSEDGYPMCIATQLAAAGRRAEVLAKKLALAMEVINSLSHNPIATRMAEFAAIEAEAEATP